MRTTRIKIRIPLFVRVASMFALCILLALALAFGLIAFAARTRVYRDLVGRIQQQNLSLAQTVAEHVEGTYVPNLVAAQMYNFSSNEHAGVTLIIGNPDTAGATTADGYYLSTMEEQPLLRPLTDLSDYQLDLYQKVLQTDNGIYQGMFGDQTHVTIAIGQPVTDRLNNTGMIVTVVRMELINTEVGEWFRMFISAAVLALIIALVFALLMVNSINRPLQQMLHTVRAIGNGKLNQRVQIRTRDELAELGDGINTMAESFSNTQRAQAFFIASVSHELRAPLTSIQGFVSAVRDGTATGEAADESLDIVLDECTRLSKLIEVLMKLMRAQAAGTPLEREWVEVVPLLQRCVDAIGGKAAPLQVNFDIQASDQCQALVNLPLIQQVFYNILDNALRYSPPGSTITLAARQDKYITTFWVDDQGCGLTPEVQAHMFDDFVTENQSRTAGGGMGLGLSIVKRIVQQHDGAVRAENNPDGGCRIAFFVANQPPAAPKEPRQRHKKRRPSEADQDQGQDQDKAQGQGQAVYDAMSMLDQQPPTHGTQDQPQQ